MAENRSDKGRKWVSGGVVVLLCLVVGGFCGYYGTRLLQDMLPRKGSPALMALSVLLLLVMLYASVLLQTVLHEGGHWLFGRLSGYRLSSIRVGGLLLARDGGKWKRRHDRRLGTGGACRMLPPEQGVDGRYPFALYLMGGCLANLLAAGLAIGLYALLPKVSGLSAFLVIFAVVGALFALLNGLPLRFGSTENDGCNVLSLRKNSEARRALRLQLQIEGGLDRGERLKDMPAAWFTTPEDTALHHALTGAVSIFVCERAMEEQHFEEARDMAAHLLDAASGLTEPQRQRLIGDQLFCELLLDNRQEEVKRLYTSSLQKFLKGFASHPSAIRLRYTLALCHERDEEKAAEALAAFEKAAARCSDDALIGEREWMEAARKAADSEKAAV